MNQNKRWRFILVILIVAWSFYEIYPPTSRDLVQEFTTRADNQDAAFTNILQRLAPLQKRSRDLSSAVARLSSDVDNLERKWSQAQAEEVRRHLEQARDELFADEAALQAWLASFRLQAAPLALQAKADFGQPVEQTTGSAEKLAVIPATVSLDFLAPLDGQEKHSPYVRLLRLSQRLSVYDKRADLTELKVEAGAGSISSAVLQYGLWAVEGDAQ